MTDISITDLTNSTQVLEGKSNGVGTFDKLMNSVNLYLDDQYKSGRLKGTDYANVLLGSIQSVLATSIQFTLQEQLTEVQIDDALKGIELKNAQIAEVYTSRVLKDKEAANLGLDEVVKNANLAPEVVYTPKYEEV